MTADLRIAVLQTGRTIPEALEEHGDYDAMCKRMVGRTPAQADTFAVLDGYVPEALDGYDVVVITGSKHGVYEDHPWIPPLETLIQRTMDAGQTMIGICFGHQIMAQALGGRAAKSDRGLGVGLMDYEFVDGEGNRAQRSLYAWHQDQVLDAPPGSTVIASSEFCPIAGLRYGNQAISLQPHPEFTRGYMSALIEARAGSALTRGAADEALASLERPCHAKDIEALMQNFMLGEGAPKWSLPS